MNNKLKIGITGCTGALGRRLTEIAVEKGFDIKCLVRKTSRLGNLAELNLEFVYGDIIDKDSLKNFTQDLDVCIHLAAQVGHRTKQEYTDTNITGTANLCEAILEHNPNCRLVNCSSISALKAKRILKFLSSNYGKSKLGADKKVAMYEKHYGLQVTTIYPGLIYGPYDTHFVPVLMKYLQQGKVFFVTGGETKGPVIFIDDLCHLFLAAAQTDSAVGHKYLGVGDLSIGIHDFIKILANKTGHEIPKKIFPKLLLMPIAALCEFFYSLLGITKAPPLSKRIVGFFSINFKTSLEQFSHNLNWSPFVSPAEGIKHTVTWQKEQKMKA